MGTDLKTDSFGGSRAGTRLCASMLWAASVVVGGVIFGAIAALEPLLLRVNNSLPLFSYILALAAFTLLLTVVWSVTATRPYDSIILSRALRKVTIGFLVPIATRIGRALGVPKDRLMSSFVEINNKLTMSNHFSLTPEQVLVLLPQCLQAADCNHRLTNNINNCERCGKCDVARLLEIFDGYGLDAWVVPGGALARELVKSKKPKVILAIACERELSSGIADTHPTPVVSIINERPNGPCVETRASCGKVAAILTRLLGEGRCVKDTSKVGGLREHETNGQRYIC